MSQESIFLENSAFGLKTICTFWKTGLSFSRPKVRRWRNRSERHERRTLSVATELTKFVTRLRLRICRAESPNVDSSHSGSLMRRRQVRFRLPPTTELAELPRARPTQSR